MWHESFRSIYFPSFGDGSKVVVPRKPLNWCLPSLHPCGTSDFESRLHATLTWKFHRNRHTLLPQNCHNCPYESGDNSGVNPHFWNRLFLAYVYCLFVCVYIYIFTYIHTYIHTYIVFPIMVQTSGWLNRQCCRNGKSQSIP